MSLFLKVHMEIKGLSKEEVRQRVEQGLTNTSNIKTDKSVKEIVCSHVFTYFNFIFIGLAILVLISGEFRSLTFMGVVIINTLVGIFQELKAKKTLDEMKLINAPLTMAIRDGKEVEVKSSDLVKDDIIILSTGDQIVADAKVIDGSVSVNESLLTGEQDSVKKEIDDDLLSGSYVVSGKCYARLTSVGDESYISKLSIEAKTMSKNEKSEMIKSIDTIIKWVGIIIIPIGVALYYQARFISDETFSKSIISMVAAVIGMIPEGLYLLTTMALTLSVVRLTKEKVLVHDMRSIEALARVDTLCVDKTGTITKPDMEVSELISLDGNDYKSLLKKYTEVISDDNATMLALRKFLKDEKANDFTLIKMTPFNSETKYSTVLFTEGRYVLGAPEFIIKKQPADLSNKISEYADKGCRVVLFGEKRNNSVTPLALIIFKNEIRENAKETFEYFKEQGVNIKVISGDNPKTVSEIATLAGIPDSEKYVDTSLLSDDELKKSCEEYIVFGRVSPKQKQILVNALKDKGHTVAMTGDGVNDILALKDADCSIAMASGAKATSEAAQSVLLDSDFSHMPEVVFEGRRVVNNIQRSASLFLVKNIFSFLMAIVSLVMTITYPLEPNQISLIGAFTIGIPGFLLALESNKNRIEGKFIRNVLVKALPAGLADVLGVGIFVICGEVFNINKQEVATVSIMIMATVGFLIMMYISKPFNKFKLGVLLINAIGLLLSIFFLKGLFSIVHISGVCFLLMMVFVFAAVTCYHLLNFVAIKIDFYIENKRWK